MKWSSNKLLKNLHGVRRMSNGHNFGNYLECFTVGLAKSKQGLKVLKQVI